MFKNFFRCDFLNIPYGMKWFIVFRLRADIDDDVSKWHLTSTFFNLKNEFWNGCLMWQLISLESFFIIKDSVNDNLQIIFWGKTRENKVIYFFLNFKFFHQLLKWLIVQILNADWSKGKNDGRFTHCWLAYPSLSTNSPVCFNCSEIPFLQFFWNFEKFEFHKNFDFFDWEKMTSEESVLEVVEGQRENLTNEDHDVRAKAINTINR